MIQILVYCRRVPWVASIVTLILIGTLAGFNFSMAQISFCPGSPPGVNVVKSACTDPLNPFNLPEAPARSEHQSIDLSASPELPQHHDVDSQTITFQQLRHVIPKKAIKEKESADKALDENQKEEAIGHLKAAIRIDPGFVRARNDLAVVYVWMGNPDPAIEQLNEAIKLDPHLPRLYMNLGIGYIVAGKFDDAERAARVAVDLDRAGTLPRFVLGSALYYQAKFTEETLQCAERTRDQHPVAHLFAARIFLERREFEHARGEIQAYLSGNQPSPAFVTVANSWLDYIATHEQKAAAVFP